MLLGRSGLRERSRDRRDRDRDADQGRPPRELPLAVLPLAFALHQIAEGFVWQDLDAGAAHSTGVRRLPLPGVRLGRPPGLRAVRDHDPRAARSASACASAGSSCSARSRARTSRLRSSRGDVSAHAVEHTVQYGGAGSLATVATALYIVATCGAPLLSGFRAIVWFGIANVVAVAAFAIIQAEGLTSIWCTWAAVVSVLIFLQFVFWRRGDDRIDREPGVPLTTAR